MLNTLQIIILLTLPVPVFLSGSEQSLGALIIVGFLIGIQCYHNVIIDDSEKVKGIDLYLHILCLLSKLAFSIGYMVITNHWLSSLLLYIVFRPKGKKEGTVALFLPILGTTVLLIPRIDTIKELLLLIFACMIIYLMTIVLYIMESTLIHMMSREEKLLEQMKVTALNELKVRNLNRELAIKYQLADTNARLEERESIARNIHNVVGHTLTSAIVSLKAYEAIRDSEPIRADVKLNAVKERMGLALEGIRRAVRVLDQETEVIHIYDFRQILHTELNRFTMDTEIEVSHNLQDASLEQWVNKRCCEFLHSVLTECLTNGIRHGNATFFVVLLQYDAHHIELSVTDNGTGFDKLTTEEQEKRLQQGYGIKKIEEFVLNHGGKMRISCDSGFGIRVELPMIAI